MKSRFVRYVAAAAVAVTAAGAFAEARMERAANDKANGQSITVSG